MGSRKLSCTPHERRVDSPDRAVRNLAREEPAAIVSLLSTLHSIVLPEVAAELLLEDARTACFAIAAAPGAWTVEELCRRTVAKMRDGRASWHQWRVAGLVAMVQGRYKEFTQAMHEVKEDTTMVDDFMLACLDVGRREGLKLGRKQGVERGLKRGVEQGLKRGVEQGLKMARETLLVVLEARSLWPTAEERKKILTQPSLQRLHHWVQRAATVSTVAEALAD